MKNTLKSDYILLRSYTGNENIVQVKYYCKKQNPSGIMPYYFVLQECYRQELNDIVQEQVGG